MACEIVYDTAYAEVYDMSYIKARAKIYDQFYHQARREADIMDSGVDGTDLVEPDARFYPGTIGGFYYKAINGAYGKVRARAEAEAEASVRAKAEAEVEARARAQAEGYTKAEAEAYTKAKVKVEAEEIAAALTTPLHNLATDCLRLSMHFFHPIQQCAQQVYHTGIPLLPTSSQLRKFWVQSIMDDQLSSVTAFLGAPNTWGLLLRTVDFRPRQLTCVTTSIQTIIAACEDTVEIYDAVTFTLQQSLYAPEMIVKIQGSPDGSTLFFAHSFSVTMWDVQTGGLIHTFITPSRITDIAVSMVGDHIACGLGDGSVIFWDIHTKNQGKCFGNGQPVVTICWLSPLEFAVATQRSIYTHNLATDRTSNNPPIPGHVWGMVYLVDRREFLVGTSQPGGGVGQELCSFGFIKHSQGRLHRQPWKSPKPMPLGQLTCPTLVDDKLVCITPQSGVQVFDTKSNCWDNSPSLPDSTISVAISLNRNLVVQTKDSIQIFSIDVLTSCEAQNDVFPSHVYPLGEKHIICVLQPDRYLALLDLESLRELRPDNSSLLGLLLMDQPPSVHIPFGCGLVAEFGISALTEAWQLGTPLPERIEAVEGCMSLSGLSPKCTRTVAVYSSPRRELRVKDAENGTILANLPIDLEDLGMGEVYDLAFDSETRFYLGIDGPEWHVRIPYDIVASPSGNYSHTVTKGEPVHLLEPRVTLPYALDANCEWVIDAESRKICWISPGNVRRGNGGHFWVGLSLVMVGDDGVVRKLTFKEPGC